MAPIRKAKSYVTYLIAILISGLFSLIRQPLPAWAEEAKTDHRFLIAQAEKPAGETAVRQRPSSEKLIKQQPTNEAVFKPSSEKAAKQPTTEAVFKPSSEKAAKQPSSEFILKQQPTGALAWLDRPATVLAVFKQGSTAECHSDQADFEKWFANQGGDSSKLSGEEYWIACSEFRIEKLTERLQQLQEKLDTAGIK